MTAIVIIILFSFERYPVVVIQNNTLLIAFLPQDPVPHVQFNLCHINSTAFSLDWPTDVCCISVPVYLCMLMLLFYYLSEEKKKAVYKTFRAESSCRAC